MMFEQLKYVDNALELKEFLNSIPDNVLEQLPLDFLTPDQTDCFPITHVTAFMDDDKGLRFEMDN